MGSLLTKDEQILKSNTLIAKPKLKIKVKINKTGGYV